MRICRRLLPCAASLDILQLSGGEPLLHPDLLRLIDFAKSLPIDHVMLNTNGLELVRNRTLAAELARRKPHLELSLQFDGLDRTATRCCAAPTCWPRRNRCCR